ncbi:MAG: N-6 DNA methylase, partial [Cyanobacteria bacterium REEB65]|nr:N-6 DNA methylase [Cyanobacteria bacterium REEB65]
MSSASQILADRHVKAVLGKAGQREQGAYYTPMPLAASIARLALQQWQDGRPAPQEPVLILDPAAGAGNLLVAAQAEADRLGLTTCLCGIDVDAGALAIARQRLPGAARLLVGDALEHGVIGRLAPPADPRSSRPYPRFDLVIGNPPFGLRTTLARDWGLLGNRADSYAAFMAMGVQLLAPGGILAFVVADSWLSIRSHEPLRRLVLGGLLGLLRLPIGAFPATVSTCLLLYRAPTAVRPARSLRAVDLTACSPASLPKQLSQWLARPPGSDRLGAAYDVDKRWMARIPGSPIFVGEPSLAELLTGDDGQVEPLGVQVLPGRDDRPAKVWRVERNGRSIALVRLGEVADVRHGLSTGANARYVRMHPDVAGRYPPVDPRRIASPERLAQITDRERQEGLPDDEPCFVPFDKGAPADAAAGWLPNYGVPTPYYVDWSRSALADMRRNPGFSWKNWRYFFRPGLTFSVSGVYAPTFRLGAGGVFEAKGSSLFSDLDPLLLLGILCSR